MNKENVQRLIDEGKTKGEIAEALGVLVKTLDMFLNAHELSVEEAVTPVAVQENSKSAVKKQTPQKARKKPNGKNAYIAIDEEEVVRLYVEARLLQREIADVFGVSRQKIAKVLCNKGINTRKRESDMKASRQEVWEMYNTQGLTRQEIADYFKVDLQVVDKFMNRHRIVLDSQYGRTKKRPRACEASDLKKNLERYLDVKKVAEHYDLKPTTIYYYINKFELQDVWEQIKKGEQVNV